MKKVINIRNRHAMDGVIPPSMKVSRRLGDILHLGANGARIVFASLISISLVVGSSLLVSGFEAHVINVTATIEKPPMCDALSKGYWRNHEGCTNGGNGSSNWTPEINTLSASFSGAFAAFTGAQICDKLWIPNCPSGNTLASKLCKAQGPTLADELNVVSGRLDLNAILAGADDGSLPFDNLGLDSNSTIRQALTVIEAIIADGSATKTQLKDAAHIAERIYTFYEDENPNKPFCIYTLSAPLSVSGASIIDTEEHSGSPDNPDNLEIDSSHLQVSPNDTIDTIETLVLGTSSSTLPEIESTASSTVADIPETVSTELENSESVEGPPPPDESLPPAEPPLEDHESVEGPSPSPPTEEQPL
ncbi:MAG: hypothetical protein HYT34_00535 [Candidatus Ryanbacteria bacterium]|nr:hypothetical protein [Candidatus Ryanbacteria bacterium]